MLHVEYKDEVCDEALDLEKLVTHHSKEDTSYTEWMTVEEELLYEKLIGLANLFTGEKRN